MTRRNFGNALTAILLVMSVLLTACQSAARDATNTVRVARIPVLDTLPLFVAQQEGLFEKHNVKVEIIPVGIGHIDNGFIEKSCLHSDGGAHHYH